MPKTLTLCTAVLLVGTLAACGEPTPDATFPPAGGDPPGTAEKLSLGAGSGKSDAGPYQSAVNCAAAIGIVTDLARRMSLAESQNQLTMLAKAADIYRRRAEGAADSGSQGAAAAIAKVTRAKRDDTSAQAQLAMACVRNLAEG